LGSACQVAMTDGLTDEHQCLMRPSSRWPQNSVYCVVRPQAACWSYITTLHGQQNIVDIICHTLAK